MNNCYIAILLYCYIATLLYCYIDYPTRIKIIHNNKHGWIVIDQIRTIDKQRIINVFEKLSEKEIEKIKAIIKETFVD